jgi:glucose-1-phosphate cytidylyltransferase
MIEIGEMPMLWHIMKIYSHYGVNDFIICCGYKGYVIKEYFAHYFLHMSDVTFDFRDNNNKIIHNNVAEPWKVTLVNTGWDTMTGGRLKRAQPYIEKGETFMLTYGDGVSDIDIKKLYEFHTNHGKIATVTSIQPKGKFGAIEINEDSSVGSFHEKPKGDGTWINGGFFVLNYDVFKYLGDDNTVFEVEPLENLVSDKEIMAYKHKGFWQCMDTMRDKAYLDELWNKGEAPWKKWK